MGKRYASPVKAAYLSDIVQQTNRVISLPGLVVMDWLHQAPTARQNKWYQTEPDEKLAGSVWLTGPEVCRKLKGSVARA